MPDSQTDRLLGCAKFMPCQGSVTNIRSAKILQQILRCVWVCMYATYWTLERGVCTLFLKKCKGSTVIRLYISLGCENLDGFE